MNDAGAAPAPVHYAARSCQYVGDAAPSFAARQNLTGAGPPGLQLAAQLKFDRTQLAARMDPACLGIKFDEVASLLPETTSPRNLM